MKAGLFLLAFMAGLQLHAQVSGISIQASGLTCSMCSNAIHKSLSSVSYVDKVVANIKSSSFAISFKPGSEVDFDQLKKKVEDAGFFVAMLTADIHFDGLKVEPDAHVKSGNKLFHFLQVKGQTLEGIHSVRILDKGFVPAKEYRKNAGLTAKACYQTGVTGSCCSIDAVSQGTRIYHVTL